MTFLFDLFLITFVHSGKVYILTLHILFCSLTLLFLKFIIEEKMKEVEGTPLLAK